MADENKNGITVKIDADLHTQVKEYIESHGMTMAEFITAACEGETAEDFAPEYGDYDDDELEDESEDADESEDEEESAGMVMGM